MIYFFLDVYIFSDIQLYPCGREQLLLFIDNCSVKLLELTECLLVLIAEAIIFLKELLQSVSLCWLNEWQELEQNNFVKWHSSSLKKPHTSAYSSEMSSGEMQSMFPSKNAKTSEKSISLKAIKATKYFSWHCLNCFLFFYAQCRINMKEVLYFVQKWGINQQFKYIAAQLLKLNWAENIKVEGTVVHNCLIGVLRKCWSNLDLLDVCGATKDSIQNLECIKWYSALCCQRWWSHFYSRLSWKGCDYDEKNI